MSIYRALALANVMLCKSFRLLMPGRISYISLSSVKPKSLNNDDLIELYNIDVDNVHSKTKDLALRHAFTLQSFLSNYIMHEHTVRSFQEAQGFVDDFYSKMNCTKTVILDSGCGRGMSTSILASKYPQYPVIGIDRSECRLLRNASTPDGKPPKLNNLLLLRAEICDFWMLAARNSDWTIHSNYILYPNPYPKSKHLIRRWHGK